MRRRMLPVLSVLALVLAACSTSVRGTGTAGVPPLVGSYTLVGDVGGTQVKTGATVTLTLKTDGTLSVLAVQPGQQLRDSGTWSTTGNSITIEFKDEQLKGTGKYDFDGITLRLPILVFGNGQGVSEWRRVGSSSTPPSGSTGPPAPLVNRDDLWDLTHDAAAAGTKAYSEAVAKGVAPKQAVQQAATMVRTMPDVTDAAVSANGRNVKITYSDGKTEDIVTERLLTSGQSAANLRTVAPTCEALPGQSPDPREPGREGVNPGGGYGVALYNQSLQPKPISSADSPPAAARRALLVAPQYDIKHPLHGSQTSIRDVAGDNIECLQGSLSKAGYTVETIAGRVDNGKKVDTGDDAIQQMVTKLTTQKYGFVYFLGHGYTDAKTNDFAGILMGPANLDRPEIKAVMNGKKIDHDLAIEITKTYTKLLGLTWDDANPPLWLAPDDDRTPTLIVKAPFFAQLRTKGADFSTSLLMIDACSSAVSLDFAQAAGPKAYLGWKAVMSGEFISHASEAIVDMLTDKARTVRAAAQLWQIHEKWKAPGPGIGSEVDYLNLLAVGAGQKPYDRIDAQTYILIFRLRHGPSSASSDIKRSQAFVQACFDQIWKFHKGALASPACHALDYGALQPTEGEVVDALFEVGAKSVGGAGRWTLAD